MFGEPDQFACQEFQRSGGSCFLVALPPSGSCDSPPNICSSLPCHGRWLRRPAPPQGCPAAPQGRPLVRCLGQAGRGAAKGKGRPVRSGSRECLGTHEDHEFVTDSPPFLSVQLAI
jgi:hypothetical protein